MVEATVGNKPTVTGTPLNGYTTLQVPAAGGVSFTPRMGTAVQTISLFAVVDRTGGATTNFVQLLHPSPLSVLNLNIDAGRGLAMVSRATGGTTTFVLNGIGATMPLGFGIVHYELEILSPTSFRMSLSNNGNPAATNTFTYSGAFNLSFNNILFSGASAAPAGLPVAGFAGLVAEALITQNNSLALRDKNVGYLAHKFGRTGLLPAGHPYKTNPPV
jgi:hypothetical protein